MRQCLDEFVLRHTIVARERHVRAQLIGPVQGDQRAHCDQAAVALRQSRPGPDIAEQDIVGQLGELRRNIAQSDVGRAMAALSRLCLRRSVLRVAHLFQPVHRLAVLRLGDGNVSHRAAG